jgi:hypothetical protein
MHVVDDFALPLWNYVMVQGWVYSRDPELVRRVATSTRGRPFQRDVTFPDGSVERAEYDAGEMTPLSLTLIANSGKPLSHGLPQKMPPKQAAQEMQHQLSGGA